MFIPFVITAPVAGGAGFIAGAFTPAIGRKIKAGFVSLAKSVVADAAKAESSATAEVKKAL